MDPQQMLQFSPKAFFIQFLIHPFLKNKVPKCRAEHPNTFRFTCVMPKQSNLGALSTLERAEAALFTKAIVPAESESECRGGSGKETLPLGWTENREK